jgi:carboxyl-terminal processing protease
MTSSAKTIWLSVLCVAVAAMLIVVGLVLGVLSPEVGRSVGEFFGLDGVSSASGINSGAGEADLQRLQAEILQRLESTYYKETDSETLATGAIDGMLASLGDPYTVYYSPEEYASLMEETSGSYSGVGMVLQMNEHLATVVSVFPGSPAESAQIEAGDIIVSVNGATTAGLTLDDVVSGIKGPEGTKTVLDMYRPAPPATTSTTVADQTQGDTTDTAADTTQEAADAAETLTVDLTGLPDGGTSKEYTLTRRSIVVPTTETETLDVAGKKVAHITLFTFNNENASQDLRDEVEKALEQDNVDAIILDLRNNGGGLLTAAVEVASIFIDSGVIVSTEGLHSREEQLRASGNAVVDVPVYVLTNEYTASASEIVAGALQDYGRATIVGETTFGKGLVQSVEPLSNGGAVKVTTAVYLTPKGRDINAKGVSPDVVAPDDPATKDVDETLQKVLDLIASGSPAR